MARLRKESCLLVSLAAMKSSVVLYYYDQDLQQEQLQELMDVGAICQAEMKPQKEKPIIIFVKKDTPTDELQSTKAISHNKQLVD